MAIHLPLELFEKHSSHRGKTMMTDDCRTFGEDFFQQLSERKSTQTTDHPLTDYDKGRDDQLEQCVNWLIENITCIEKDGIPRYLKNSSYEECAVIDEWKIISDLRKAMRPQGDNND